MQTFLPYPDFYESAAVLDWRRLGKQRVEAMTIYKVLTEPDRKGWRNHPAVRMWAGYEDALADYHDGMIFEWTKRGYTNNMPLLAVPHSFDLASFTWRGYLTLLPPWIGDPEFHRSHQSNLIRKDPVHYQRFWPGVPDDLPYVWPV